MPVPFAVLALALAQTTPDPYLLPIGAKGVVMAQPNAIISTANGKAVTAADIAAAADGFSYVGLGESHDSPAHHRLQADVILELVKRGRNVIVGMEMYTRPKQDSLWPWTTGAWDQDTFVAESDWKGQWGFPFELYQPIFEAVRANKLPLIALNVPRDWVRAVGRGGYEALTPEMKSQLPGTLDLGNQEHRMIFGALMGGHPPTGTQGENIYKAQVLWDEGMSDTAIKYMQSRPANPKTVFVVVAGAGHIMYGQGITWRIQKRTGQKSLNVVMIDGTEPRTVSKGLADYVAMAAPPKRVSSSTGKRP